MDTISLKKNDPNYPSALKQRLGKDAPDTITAIGNLDILRHNSTAFFCSTKCPGKNQFIHLKVITIKTLLKWVRAL
ncbi:MAG: hypothetical protein KKH20_07675 [Proteobacteria bacterium]|nr:hypothetical protein [Desulfobacteraceae bacterium]MBU4067435.1 hypothetical protein [Pseudomonadota bacterium]MBU4101242.1 hypothetical protein [Pseudomonadota bacterium]MBU4128132.1 hypothetical protein [Pseudomonadota bacterium]